MNFAHPLMEENVSRADLDELIHYLSQESPRLTHGPLTRKFEEQWSEWLGVEDSVLVNSGSSANDVTMQIVRHEQGPGEVIVPPLTWVSDIASVIKAGLKPVFADISLETLGLEPKEVDNVLSKKTRSVFLTHVLGLNALSDNLRSVLAQSEAVLVEDCCESHGAFDKGGKVGTNGWLSNFSFYFAHHLSTIEGGMICSNDEALIEQARMRRSHGLVRENRLSRNRESWAAANPSLNPEFIFGYAAQNVRPTELQSIIGLSQLGRLDDGIEKRRANFRYFMEQLDGNLYLNHFDTVQSSNYAFIVVLREPDFATRDRIEEDLRLAGIEFRRGLSGGGNQLRQPYLRAVIGDVDFERFPNVEHVHHFGWYVGNYPDLDSHRIDNLLEVLNSQQSRR